MIKYEFLDYANHSTSYLSDLSEVYELVIDRHSYSFDDIYVVCYHPKGILKTEKIIFRCNNKYELKIWMDLNGFNYQSCKIFYKPNHEIGYVSFLLRKED